MEKPYIFHTEIDFKRSAFDTSIRMEINSVGFVETILSNTFGEKPQISRICGELYHLISWCDCSVTLIQTSYNAGGSVNQTSSPL